MQGGDLGPLPVMVLYCLLASSIQCRPRVLLLALVQAPWGQAEQADLPRELLTHLQQAGRPGSQAAPPVYLEGP